MSQREGVSLLTLRSDAPTQRGASDLVIKGLRILGVDVDAWLGLDPLKEYVASIVADKAACLADEREIVGRSDGLGVYQCNSRTPYAQFTRENLRRARSDQVLVLVHGFFSSATGAFDGLWQTGGNGVRNALFKSYEDAVYCFDHATLGQSPIQNALDLVSGLEEGTRLHLLAHSRGGLVCEVLSRAQSGERGFRPLELEMFAKLQPDDGSRLRELMELMERKRLRVERVVRVGSPMRGTWLASNRLDRWLSIFYNVVRYAVPPGPQFVADHVFDVLATVVKKRLDRQHFPGIEAMSPTSPLIALLNDSPPLLDDRLTVIAGDCEGSGLLHRLKVLITDGFFGESHDLVVPTTSMFGGAPRRDGTSYFFHRTPKVDHFQYFSHDDSLQRIRTGLIGTDDEWKKMQRLDRVIKRQELTVNRADQRVRSDAPLNLILPGIMGTELAFWNNDRVWIDLGDFACGNFPALGLAEEAPEQQSYPEPGSKHVFPLGPLRDFYGDLADELQRRGELVLPMGYDWRKPIRIAAEVLAKRLEKEWPDDSPRPLRIVAHSMGGLVARAMFARDPKLRERFERSSQNRLLMLGTPNAGSMAIAKALLGDNKQIGWISLLAPQSEQELLTVAATFPGFHELLPQMGRIWEKQSVWATLFEQHRIPASKRPFLAAWAMTRATQGRTELRNSIATLPFRNTVYVAGFVDPMARDATVVDIDEHGEYVRGPGDGTVSYRSGLIEGVPTYYANAPHGDLPSYRRAFTAYFELLERGETNLLPMDWRNLHERRRGVLLETFIPEQMPYRPSRSDLYRQLLGASAQGIEELEATLTDPIVLRIVNGGLRFARHPLMVGHYLGDVVGGSEAELDRQFEGQLRKALDLGVYPAEVETFQVFERKHDTHDERSPFAVVVGLGRPGELSVGKLHRTVKRGILGWFGTTRSESDVSVPRNAFSIVLLGSAASGMTVSECAMAILRGVQDAQRVIALWQQARTGRDIQEGIDEIELVEVYEDKALELAAELPRLLANDEFGDAFRLIPKLEQRSDAVQRLRDERRGVSTVQRLDIRVYGERLRYTLPGIQAAVPVMKRDIDIAEIRAYAREIDEQLSTNRALGRVLFNQLLPLELKQFALEQYDLVLSLNESAASLPWELADSGSRVPLSVQSGMIRQLHSARYSPRERVSTDSALVIGEPQVDGLLPLSGARSEAADVAKVLETAGFKVKYLDRPSAVQVRDELGKRPYRIIHFAGHGMVDYLSPLSDAKATPHTGMVIGSLMVDGNGLAVVPMGDVRGDSTERAAHATSHGVRHWLLLTPDDVRECVAQVPEMVFINCCHLGRQVGVARNAPKMASNLANSFMEIGCRAVVAAGWAIEDGAAATFAGTLYDSMVQVGDSFINAVRDARSATFRRFGASSLSWGAYQCYGDPGYRAVRHSSVSASRTFNTDRELEYWLKERGTATMGLTGEALEMVRQELLEVIEREVSGKQRCEDVFQEAVSVCEAVGEYRRTAELIQVRINHRFAMTSMLRSIQARVHLRLAMTSPLDSKERNDWIALADESLDNLKASANLENSGELWFDLGRYLRRRFILEAKKNARVAVLRQLVSATREGWRTVIAGITLRRGCQLSKEKIDEEITDEQAQKMLMVIIIKRAMEKRRVSRRHVPNGLPNYTSVLKHCKAKFETRSTSVEFWDDADQAHLRLLLLATPRSMDTSLGDRTQAQYYEEATTIAELYRFAMSLSATESERESIATSVLFWHVVSEFFVDMTGQEDRLHWTLLHKSLDHAFPLGAAGGGEEPPRPPGQKRRANGHATAATKQLPRNRGL